MIHNSALDLVESAVGILVQGPTVLIGKRATNSRYGGKWEFPGGKLEPGESWEQALIRELNEELGIDVLTFLPFHASTNRFPDRGLFSVHYALVTKFHGVPSPIVHDALQWVQPSALRSFDILAGNSDVIEMLISHGLPDTPA